MSSLSYYIALLLVALVYIGTQAMLVLMFLFNFFNERDAYLRPSYYLELVGMVLLNFCVIYTCVDIQRKIHNRRRQDDSPLL